MFFILRLIYCEQLSTFISTVPQFLRGVRGPKNTYEVEILKNMNCQKDIFNRYPFAFPEAYFVYCQTYMMYCFCENSSQFLADNHSCKKAPSLMLGRVLNMLVILTETFFILHYIVGNKEKGWISKRVLQENKVRQIFRKTSISYSLIRTCKMLVFRKISRASFSCNTRFEIRPSALLPTILTQVLSTQW